MKNNMKFRIVSQRGVFRIQSPKGDTCREYETTTNVTTGYLWWKKTDVVIGALWGKQEDWKFHRHFTEAEGLTWNKAYEFDTYKKAEDYIKKFYGSTGVDAIEKPEWKTV